ncbi:hemolysin-III channel protein-like protein Izh2 [Xylariaceae sp. FL0016]|nr:hemolysin-III channel protein-like protein Izh2 [Xylariaceae sp. FL0016]
MAVQQVSGFQAQVATVKAQGPWHRGRRGSLAQDRNLPRPEESRASLKHRQLLEWEGISPWRQHGSDHLWTGYREENASVRACFGSWLYIHNDTVSIFSHVVGAIVFLALPLWAFTTEIPPRYQIATTSDVVVCSIYFVGVAICFVFSTLFHTFMCHSESWYLLGIKFDYQGILLLMWGSTIPLVYYSFPGETNIQVLYWIITTVLAGLCSLATFHPSIGGPHLGHVRAMLFGAFGFGSFLAPIAHGVLKYGSAEQHERIGLSWIGLTAICNLTGVVFYAFKFPERWYPRTFDIWGASHQIMHVMVVFAALAYVQAVLQAFDFYHQILF